MKKKIPVVIDTDIGDDIDDAFALCLAMQSPEIRLLGVTTVFKNTVARAKIARRLLRLGGFPDIPVAAGASVPLANPEMFNKKVDVSEFPCTYRQGWENEKIEAESGTDLLIRLLEESSEPVTVVTLGALTNLADLLRRRPDLKEKIRCIHMMGGAFLINWTEYNFACDPEAAQLVLASQIPIRAVGVDVTLGCMVGQRQIEQLRESSHPCLQMLMDMCKEWTKNGCVCLHDPLALYSVWDPSVLSFKKEVYQVECRGRYSRGVCVKMSDHNWQADPQDSRLMVAQTVKADEFVGECIRRLCLFG